MLDANKVYNFFENNTKSCQIRLSKVLGEGGMCVAYEGWLIDEQNYEHRGVLKEYYPANLKLKRDDNSNLIIIKQQLFDEGKKMFLASYEKNLMFSNLAGTTNTTVSPHKILYAHNTIYMWMQFNNGVPYDVTV